MTRLAILFWFILAPCFAIAQDRWVQIEAQPSLLEAEARAREYASQFNDVQAFSIGSGWYAIAIGPFGEDTARLLLNDLLSAGQIPRDSFLSTGTNYRQKIWPTGLSNSVTTLPPAPQVADPVPEITPEAEPTIAIVETTDPEPSVPDETPRQARASEQALSRDQRKDLQIMLQWAGYYNSTIDGAFGRGTRSAMAAWQADQGFEPTGILTTQQRQILADQYNAVLKDLGLASVINQEAGIAIDMPLAKVAFDTYAAPLAHYASKTSGREHVFLISQAGNQDDLAALFEVIQTLSLVPRDANAKLSGNSFEITGTLNDAETYVTATLARGEIKGFGIVWPNANPEQITRLFDRMRTSFTPVDGTLSPALAQNVGADMDLVYGLDIRRPLMMRSGVYISQDGTLLTAAEGLDLCRSFVIEGEVDAQLVEPNTNGLAILQPSAKIAPPATARLATQSIAIGQDLFLTSYPYGGRLNAPTVTLGSVADLRGLDNDTAKMRLELPANQNDIGGPVFDAFGGLHGILVSPNASGRILPNDTQVAINLGALSVDLGLAKAPATQNELKEDELVAALSASTALIECWEN